MFDKSHNATDRSAAGAWVRRITTPLRATILFLFALAAPSSVAAEDKVISVTSEGAGVSLDVRNAPRREVVERLLGNDGIRVEWLNSTIADETISGTYRGPAFVIVRQLLTEIDFAVAYDANDDRRISRVVISGRSGKQSVPSWQPTADISGPGGPPPSFVPVGTPPPSFVATGIAPPPLTPMGIAVPQLTPLPAETAALSLTPVPAGTRPPPLVRLPKTTP